MIISMEQEKKEEGHLVQRVLANPQFGLSFEQVKEREKVNATNQAVDSATKSVREIIKSNVFT